ncbi:hypothetical protein BKA62DRAFT_367160 [Auriculariales sp. MPI-PUGE-AT-0066]|nr:hypothetical protein BKA62DRAFT_367160 [Auriculariales sp. MPI-PUGE-AT-0066]
MTSATPCVTVCLELARRISSRSSAFASSTPEQGTYASMSTQLPFVPSRRLSLPVQPRPTSVGRAPVAISAADMHHLVQSHSTQEQTPRPGPSRMRSLPDMLAAAAPSFVSRQTLTRSPTNTSTRSTSRFVRTLRTRNHSQMTDIDSTDSCSTASTTFPFADDPEAMDEDEDVEWYAAAVVRAPSHMLTHVLLPPRFRAPTMPHSTF